MFLVAIAVFLVATVAVRLQLATGGVVGRFTRQVVDRGPGGGRPRTSSNRSD